MRTLALTRLERWACEQTMRDYNDRPLGAGRLWCLGICILCLCVAGVPPAWLASIGAGRASGAPQVASNGARAEFNRLVSAVATLQPERQREAEEARAELAERDAVFERFQAEMCCAFGQLSAQGRRQCAGFLPRVMLIPSREEVLLQPAGAAAPQRAKCTYNSF